MAAPVKGGRAVGEKLHYSTLACKLPDPYVTRLRQAALHLNLSLAGLIRASVEKFARENPDLPPGLAQDLLELGAEITSRPQKRCEPYIASATSTVEV